MKNPPAAPADLIDNRTVDRRLPVTVLSGFLGAGKTTILNHLLNNREGLRIALIVNDMSEVNIDAALVGQGAAAVAQREEKIVEMSNGCICCTLREDLLVEVAQLAKENRFDYLVIESTGISEPLPVAETFTFADENGATLDEVARLDTMVTVVDGYNILKDYGSDDSLFERGQVADEEDERDLATLLAEQIEFADVIVLNKIDLLDDAGQERVVQMVRALNPSAQLHCVEQGRIPIAEVLNTHRFSFDDASKSPLWLQTLRGEESSESDEYGIGSFVYRSRRPFHPQRFHRWASSPPENVIRSKGFFFLASRMHQVGSWSQAGGISQQGPAGYWWAAVGKEHWPAEGEPLDQIQRNWEEPFGDRRQELVFIGNETMDREVLTAQLDACLLTNEELERGARRWSYYVDPFPLWE